MQYPNLFKRIIPFALTLMLGLFVAGFFVSLLPSFRTECRRKPHQLRVEYGDLKTENERLKSRVQELEDKYEVPCEETRQAGPQDLLDRRCFAEGSPQAEKELRKELMEREKQLMERLKKFEQKDKK